MSSPGSSKSYREAMATFAGMTNLEVWYARLDVEKVFNEYRSKATPDEIKRFERNLAKAQGKDNMKAFAKLTEEVDGEYRIKSDPPIVVALARPVRRRRARRAAGLAGGPHPRVPPHACSPTVATCSRATGWSTSPGRWSGSAASAPGAGSP